MRKLIIYCLLLIGVSTVAFKGYAQVSINLALNSRPQPWLADWANPVNGIMILNYMPGVVNDPAVKIRTTITELSGNLVATSNISAARLYILKDGANQFTMADALQLQNLAFVGSYKANLQQSGRLPAGQYQLTVQLTNTTGDVVRATQTRPFFVTSYQLPVLVSPANGGNVNAHVAQSIIVFRWTPLTPAYTEPPVYRVLVFEVLPEQTPMQAFRVNRPLLDEQMRGITQYAWRTNLPMLDSTANRQFIWTVQTTDKDGRVFPGNQASNILGYCEPALFHIVGLPAIVKEEKHEDK
ncbi:hypothetical protein HQ865_12825 [Mucilaginibacter mali]|uniref:Uncharacterized protein n=1 Tax=Mucilaginibacter mali TaxID=2740462 RepID=A0A7D4PUV6_9SPHI|nr:hypothetical protein [Mucilaginibacter mali]QKJ30603.1 hypothetical protein HQ865_12825 [Mucilaginibacter mali]